MEKVKGLTLKRKNYIFNNIMAPTQIVFISINTWLASDFNYLH